MTKLVRTIGIGNAGITKMQSFAWKANSKQFQLFGADYFWGDFCWPTSNQQVMSMPIIYESTYSDTEWNLPTIVPDNETAIADLKGIPAARSFFESRGQEIEDCVGGAKIVVLLIGLDCTLAFATCDLVCRIARQAGAVVVAFVTTPLDGVDDVHQDVMNRLSEEANCLISSDGFWSECYLDFPCKSWDWGWNAGALSVFQSIGYWSDVDYSGIQQMLTQSGNATFGTGWGDSAEEAVEMAVDTGLNGGSMATIQGAITVVTGHPAIVEQMLHEVQEAMFKALGGKISCRKATREIYLTNPDDELPSRLFFSIYVLFTGVKFANPRYVE